MSDIHAQYQKRKEPSFLSELLQWSLFNFVLFGFASCGFQRMLTGEVSFITFASGSILFAIPITWGMRFIRYGRDKG